MMSKAAGRPAPLWSMAAGVSIMSPIPCRNDGGCEETAVVQPPFAPDPVFHGGARRLASSQELRSRKVAAASAIVEHWDASGAPDAKAPASTSIRKAED